MIPCSQVELEAHTLTVDFTRARLTAQHAHMYHKQVLDTTDRVRNKKLNMVAMISPMNLVQMEEDHREGVKESIRAQACLNETLRLFDKHPGVPPDDIVAQLTRVRELGVSQVTTMYNLLYGNSSGSIPQQMNTLSQRQEEAFACLTKIAVTWQNFQCAHVLTRLCRSGCRMSCHSTSRRKGT